MEVTNCCCIHRKRSGDNFDCRISYSTLYKHFYYIFFCCLLIISVNGPNPKSIHLSGFIWCLVWPAINIFGHLAYTLTFLLDFFYYIRALGCWYRSLLQPWLLGCNEQELHINPAVEAELSPYSKSYWKLLCILC